MAMTVLGACTYDWAIGSAGADGGADGGKDAGTGGGAGAGGADAGSDGGDCAALDAAVEQKRVAARVCSQTTPGSCSKAVKDACGCNVFVADTGSAEAQAYLAAVSALVAAGCAPKCSSCPGGPVIGACGPDMMGGTRCIP